MHGRPRLPPRRERRPCVPPPSSVRRRDQQDRRCIPWWTLAVPPNGRRARWYRPTASASALVRYLHGGGWVIGDLETHDRACRRLAASSGAAVLALDYRRAPEHPWPAAVDDAVDALRWIASRPRELGLAPTALAIAGDSAGGTTAALACVRVRDEAPEALPDVQVLISANTDLGNSGASMREKGHGYGLDVADIAWFNSQWVPDASMLTDPRVSPLYVPDLGGLPAAIVITCEHDPLHDQGEAYAERLRAAGVPTTMRRSRAWSTTSCSGTPSRRRARPRPIADQARSKRSRFMTLTHAATKSRTNLSPASLLA